MKSWGVALGFLLVMAQAGGVSARSLEDVLKEKGVITEEDYREITKVKPIDYKIGKGFTFTSQDEKFQLSLGGRMQLQYNYFDKDGTPDVSQWRARRIKLYTSGYAYTKDLTYAFQVDFVNASKPTLLDDAYLNYRFLDEIQIRFGQFKTPFVRQEIISDATLQFVDRSPVADNFKHGRDFGAMIHGKIAGGLAGYNFGVFNGAGQSTLRSSTAVTANDNAIVARAYVNPLGDVAYSEADPELSVKPLLSMGTSFLSNTFRKNDTPAAAPTAFALGDVDAASASYFGRGWLGSGLRKFSSTEKVDVTTFGFDTAFKWMGFSAQGEYLIGQADGKSSGKTLRSHGFYAQTGYCIIPKKLEAAMRYSYYDPDRDVSNNLQTEIAGAVSYYFDKHNLKLQADVANLHSQPLRSDEIQFRLQAQITY